jgi:hypothetical protein
VPIAAASIHPTRQTVNSKLNFNVVGFPHNADVQITWKRNSGSIINIATVHTNSVGAVSGYFLVPATTGGPNQPVTFKSGSVSKTVLINVPPRIKILTTPGVRGQKVEVSLRGYQKGETVRIRWAHGAGWTQIATATTSNTGSANIFVTVPSWAPNGFNSVRGDGNVSRAQTNIAFINGGPGPTAAQFTAATAGEPAAGFPSEFAAIVAPAVATGLFGGWRLRRRKRA